MLRFIAEKALGEISATDVALAAGLHPNYARSIFKKAVGLTVKQAITRHRLDARHYPIFADFKRSARSRCRICIGIWVTVVFLRSF
jgi:hypothetical protein